MVPTYSRPDRIIEIWSWTFTPSASPVPNSGNLTLSTVASWQIQLCLTSEGMSMTSVQVPFITDHILIVLSSSCNPSLTPLWRTSTLPRPATSDLLVSRFSSTAFCTIPPLLSTLWSNTAQVWRACSSTSGSPLSTPSVDFRGCTTRSSPLSLFAL